MKKSLLLTIFMIGLLPILSLDAMEKEHGKEISLKQAEEIYDLLTENAKFDQREYNEVEFEDLLRAAVPVLAKHGKPLQSHYFNPLDRAVIMRNPDLVRFLIQYGANPNFNGREGRTAVGALVFARHAHSGQQALPQEVEDMIMKDLEDALNGN